MYLLFMRNRFGTLANLLICIILIYYSGPSQTIGLPLWHLWARGTYSVIDYCS